MKNPIPKSKAYIACLILAALALAFCIYVLYTFELWQNMAIYLPVMWGLFLDGTLDFSDPGIQAALAYIASLFWGLAVGLVLVGFHYRFKGYKTYTFGVIEGVRDRETAGPIKSK